MPGHVSAKLEVCGVMRRSKDAESCINRHQWSYILVRIIILLLFGCLYSELAWQRHDAEAASRLEPHRIVEWQEDEGNTILIWWCYALTTHRNMHLPSQIILIILFCTWYVIKILTVETRQCSWGLFWNRCCAVHVHGTRSGWLIQ